jgi:hypothetical protein
VCPTISTSPVQEHRTEETVGSSGYIITGL